MDEKSRSQRAEDGPTCIIIQTLSTDPRRSLFTCLLNMDVKGKTGNWRESEIQAAQQDAALSAWSENNHQNIGIDNKKSTRDRAAMKLPVRSDDNGVWNVSLQ
ncbi:hypothetical protein Q8A73_021159 [Channa argus]|nr:hypothetical protein Q8A73_021159 [Channa argus]